ncbi:hypothetical protein SLEP1_g34491 [Rubroshorea leprosula]|uniref:NECAP PHear domain-containing protein n=1 Tax=Rubroshorea leprosula TaxID=152421 RepID=A0AAV5KK47_9ROSI|nr:hypothetical protein SLEP1_g34491 [Rubroshorea leprosula]
MFLCSCHLKLVPSHVMMGSLTCNDGYASTFGLVTFYCFFKHCVYHAGGRVRHAFIGIGFRERTEAYDFQAALHDHMKYLNKKRTAEEMEQQFQNTSSVDYSLKEGETLVLQIKTKGGSSAKSKILEQGISNLSIEDKGKQKEAVISIKPPPPPPTPLSPASTVEKASNNFSQKHSEGASSEGGTKPKQEDRSLESQSTEDIPDDDFGDFQAAG